MLHRNEIIRLGIIWLTDKEYYPKSMENQIYRENADPSDNPLWRRFDLKGPSGGLTWANLVACRVDDEQETIRRVTEYLETEIAIANVLESV